MKIFCFISSLLSFNTVANGDLVKITHLPSCKNAKGAPNPYAGMQGVVHDFNGETFNLKTDGSWLVGVDVRSCSIVHLI